MEEYKLEDYHLEQYNSGNVGPMGGKFYEIITLPEGLKVRQGLYLRGCTSLTTLPEGLNVGGNLVLSGCINLTVLPEGLHVGGFLDLSNCTRITALPEGLKVEGYLYLKGCTSLTTSPERLKVGKSLSLDGCTNLTALPEGLKVGRNLSLGGCTGITALPECIFEWGPALWEHSDIHDIYLGGSGISEETLDWLCNQDFPYLRFHVDRSDQDAPISNSFQSLKEAIQFWIKESKLDESDDLVSNGEQQLSQFQQTSVISFLSRLQGAKEFGIQDRKQSLAKRVVEMLDILLSSTADTLTKESMIVRMSDSLDACHDKPIWALNQMHVTVEIAKAREDKEQLKELAKRVMRLNIVHKHAKDCCDKLSFVDDVCVYLRFEMDLMNELDLPVSATAMHFPNYIKIEQQDIEKAKKEALNITNEEFESFMKEWSPWQRQQRKEAVENVTIDSLPKSSKRRSISGRLETMIGEIATDGVILGDSQYSLSDLKKHWMETGMDFNNIPWSIDDFLSNLKMI